MNNSKKKRSHSISSSKDELTTKIKLSKSNKIQDIDLNSGIIDEINLKFIVTKEIVANNNKSKFCTLFYDGTEYITIEEWENSMFFQFAMNDNVCLKFFSVKEMEVNRYLVNYNVKNIQLIKLSKSKVNISSCMIPDINSFKSIFKLCNDYDICGKKLTNFTGIIKDFTESILYNKKCLNIIVNDYKNPKYSITLVYWNLANLKRMFVYDFKNIIFKKEGSKYLFSTSMFIYIIEYNFIFIFINNF
jgi:hypothetical protein